MNKIQNTILLCDDDVNFGMLLADYLRQEGYIVDFVSDGEEGWQMFEKKHYDACILDVMMPIRTGLELAKNIRMTGSDVPIFFLTARNSVDDILEGYKNGCDDYITKPCPMVVLLCKIEAVLKRYHHHLSNITIFQLGAFTYNYVKQALTLGNEERSLSSRENELLYVFAQNQNRLVETNMILTSVWHNNSYFANRSLSVYINHLRTLLNGDDKVKLMTIHGKGYKLVVLDE